MENKEKFHLSDIHIRMAKQKIESGLDGNLIPSYDTRYWRGVCDALGLDFEHQRTLADRFLNKFGVSYETYKKLGGK